MDRAGQGRPQELSVYFAYGGGVVTILLVWLAASMSVLANGR
jgi:hypothetical protein